MQATGIKPYLIDPSLLALFRKSECGAEREPTLPILPAEFTERSNLRGWIGTLQVILPLFALTAAAPLLVLHMGIWTLLLLVPLLGAYIYKTTIVLHDCCHFTLFRTSSFNWAIGILAAALVGTDFEEFRRSHMRHHRNNGQAGDPEGEIYPELTRASRSRLLWHCLRPLTGLTFLEAFSGGTFVVRPPGAEAERLADQPTRKLRQFALIAGLQVALAALATGFGAVWWLLPLYPATAATWGLFFGRLRGFCEHIPPSEWSQGPFVRSHVPNWFDRIFFYTLGMNYHVEHHIYPTVPGYRLGEVLERLRPIHTGDTLSTSIIGTVARRLATS